MQTLTTDEIEQVSGGLTFLRDSKGIFSILWDYPSPDPSTGPVIPEMD